MKIYRPERYLKLNGNYIIKKGRSYTKWQSTNCPVLASYKRDGKHRFQNWGEIQKASAGSRPACGSHLSSASREGRYPPRGITTVLDTAPAYNTKLIALQKHQENRRSHIYSSHCKPHRHLRERRSQLMAHAAQSQGSPALQVRSPGKEQAVMGQEAALSSLLLLCSAEKQNETKRKQMPREEAEFGAECKSRKAMGTEERLCIPLVENIRACTLVWNALIRQAAAISLFLTPFFSTKK